MDVGFRKQDRLLLNQNFLRPRLNLPLKKLSGGYFQPQSLNVCHVPTLLRCIPAGQRSCCCIRRLSTFYCTHSEKTHPRSYSDKIRLLKFNFLQLGTSHISECTHPEMVNHLESNPAMVINKLAVYSTEQRRAHC